MNKMKAYEFVNITEDEFDEMPEFQCQRMQRKEIKSKWEKKEDGLNIHNSKSLSTVRKW